MTEIAILGPTTLLGKEVHQELERRPHLWDRIQLVAASDEEQGTVTESAGAAALVAPPEPQALASSDLVIACGTIENDLPLVRERLDSGAPGTTAILLSSGATAEHGDPIISGVNPDAATGGTILVSPDPSAVALAYLLAPFAGTASGAGPVARDAIATVVLPVSSFGSQGLDDLFDQTREVLAMSGERRATLFARQLAFSLYPAALGGGMAPAALADLVRRTTGADLPIAVEALQGAIFHGISVQLFLRFEDDPGEEGVRDALAAQRHVRLSDPETEPADVPAPIDAASSEDLLVGRIRPAREIPGGYWIWAVMDNLTRGGALNAVEIAELLQKIA